MSSQDSGGVSSASTRGRPTHSGLASSTRRPTVLAAVVAFAVTAFQQPQPFLYDAAAYWQGSLAVTHGRDVYSSALLDIRGVLTIVLYLPAALATRVTGASTAGSVVLVENSILIAVLGAVVLPRVVGMWHPRTPATVYLTTTLTVVAVSRFAPYPLTDVWAAVLIYVAVISLARTTPRALLSGGLLAGAAANVRPAYLLAAALLVVVILGWVRARGLWAVGGVAVALLPQSILNAVHGSGWAPWPPATGALTRTQAAYGSFAVRYDTVIGTTGDPRQFYCSPSMAEVVGIKPPTSDTQLAELFLRHPVQSVPFAAEKIAGALHWPVSAPYFHPAPGSDLAFAVLITVVTALGLAALVSTFSPTLPHVLLAVLAVGTIAPIVTSVPETRFSLSLVLLGIAGCASLRGRRRPVTLWLVAAIVSCLLLAVSYLGLAHPAVPGGTSAAACGDRLG